MKGIYLTEEGKQEIEAEIAELEYIFEREGELFSSRDSGKYHLYKEILSSATILPVEESWKSMVEGDDDYEHYIENVVCFPTSYPNGVIIQPKQ
jgi:hypothetical protein